GLAESVRLGGASACVRISSAATAGGRSASGGLFPPPRASAPWSGARVMCRAGTVGFHGAENKDRHRVLE
ncbi:hypothetical protein ACWD4L_18345, partial [Streptomyces sp. NPDC002596]